MDHHIRGAIMHILYCLLVIVYIMLQYCYDHKAPDTLDKIYPGLLAIGILYPWIYDLIQLINDGPKVYFLDSWNWIDFFYIYGSILNIIFQLTIGKHNIFTVINFCFIIVFLVIKTFFFLRIMESFTPIVIMMTNVIYDLRIFMLFYTILLFMFSLMFSVVGVGLDSIQTQSYTDDPNTRRLAEETHRELAKKSAGSKNAV